jgi:hypothetical protein
MAIAYVIWAVMLVPVTLLMLWFGFGEWSLRGFFTGFLMLAVICITFELFEKWIEQKLRRRRSPPGS